MSSLKEGTTYSFDVVAINRVGGSVPNHEDVSTQKSITKGTITPYGVPTLVSATYYSIGDQNRFTANCIPGSLAFGSLLGLCSKANDTITIRGGTNNINNNKTYNVIDSDDTTFTQNNVSLNVNSNDSGKIFAINLDSETSILEIDNQEPLCLLEVFCYDTFGQVITELESSDGSGGKAYFSMDLTGVGKTLSSDFKLYRDNGNGVYTEYTDVVLDDGTTTLHWYQSTFSKYVVVQSFVYSVPGIPRSVTAIPFGSNTILLSWLPPLFNGNQPLTRYIVTVYDAFGVNMVKQVYAGAASTSPTAPRKIMIGGLDNDNEYTLSVAASNEEGVGEESTPYQLVHVFEGEVPCILSGSMILTPRGNVEIDKLRTGDRITDSNGLPKVITNILCSPCAWNSLYRIRANSFGEHGELVLSHGHRFYEPIRGKWFHIECYYKYYGRLEGTVEPHESREGVAIVYHLQLEDYSLDSVIANGVRCESWDGYMNTEDRAWIFSHNDELGCIPVHRMKVFVPRKQLVQLNF
jgi:hypothetical protein